MLLLSKRRVKKLTFVKHIEVIGSNIIYLNKQPNNQTKIINKTKNSMYDFISTFDTAEERISDLESKSKSIT
jgi:hypothetical protein